MKKYISIMVLALLACAGATAQAIYDVSTIDRHSSRAYRPGEVIVNFKPTSPVKVSASRTGAVRCNVSLVDTLFAQLGVTAAEQLMPLAGSGGPARVKSHTGKYIERTDLSKLYRLQLDAEKGVTVDEAIKELANLPEVEFAEPNYLVYALSTPPADHDESDENTYRKEPLFKEQWYIEAIHLTHLWKQEKISDKRPVIAILDTGVDITHPDLADNIWTNGAENEGFVENDDDANGLMDDIHGWDFVNQSARMRDNNGHGTHVAGIAAAVDNNGIGIAGANPEALIMPVTVMQSDGTGDVATIIKGIDYAAANGADVINMSLGTYAHSLAMEQSLARAYSTAVLVAAAGNDNKNICKPCDPGNEPMFPAAFTFVFGVEATNRDGSRAVFSNFDPDGPIYSHFSEEQLYNYELRAPGVSIMSTYPGGKYKVLNGTSMSSPLVAGAISRLLQCKEYESKELLFGDLIHACNKNDNGVVDFQATYETKDEDRKPTLQFVTYSVYDGEAADSDIANGLIRPITGMDMPLISTDGKEFWYKMVFPNLEKFIYASTAGSELQSFREFEKGTKRYNTVEGNSTSSTRRFDSFAITDGENELNVTDIQPDFHSPIFADKVSNVFVTKPGAQITFSDFNWIGRLMHAYAYIDFNDDGLFDEDWMGEELVTYNCMYDGAGWWHDIYMGVADPETANSGHYMYDGRESCGLPGFFIPAEIAPGDYRMRIKIDYNNSNPDGSLHIKNGGCQVDFTLRIDSENAAFCEDEEMMLWKVVGSESEGYGFVNKLGYTLYVVSTEIGETVCAAVSPQGTTKFNIKKPESSSVLGFEIHPMDMPSVALNIQETGEVVLAENGNINNQIIFKPLDGEDYNADNGGSGSSGITELGGDGDGKPDTGELLEFYPTLRNCWGNAENISISLSVAENEDPTIVEIIDTVACFGQPLSSYAKAKSDNPIRIKISDKCVDGRKIRLLLRATCDNISEPLEEEFVITVENSVEIGGLLFKNLTLYPNAHYIVTKTLAVPRGVTLTIKPGTVIEFNSTAGLTCEGELVCDGKPDSLIVFKHLGDRYTGPGIKGNNHTIRYTKITGFECPVEYSALSQLHIVNSILEENTEIGVFISLEKCVVIYNSTYSESPIPGVYCNVVRNTHFIKDAYDFTYSNVFSNEIEKYIEVGDGIWRQLEVPCNMIFETSGYEVRHANNYFGSVDEETVRDGIWDMHHPLYPTSGSGYVDLSNMATRPYSQAHGIVWKVLVNGYDAQDEFKLLSPLGVGKHKFEVYFNRPMDVSVAPNIYMGVRPPYTQVPIAEDGEWSADSLVYTAYLTIDGKTNSDGLNRIYVDGAKDNEYFDIPIENRRFNVELAAAGSMATGLMAEAGLGKVTLTWNTDEDDFEDLLGYNIYRYTDYIDSTYTYYDKYGNYVGGHWDVRGDTTIVNPMILEPHETDFVDEDVIPGTTYYYVIKQLTTSLDSHPLSNVVAVTPKTAQKGDANGSMAVDVADVVTEIAYINEQEPEPFIFEAADVNSDSCVNILDVVGTVAIITTPETVGISSLGSTATYTIEDGILYIENDIAIGGIQLSIAAAQGTEFTPLEAIRGFEQVGTWMSNGEYRFLVFSMSGKSLAPGKHAILRIGGATLGETILADSRGANIMALNGNITGIGAVESMQMRLPYPNPFSTTLTIPYIIGKEGEHKVNIVVSDIAGRAVYSYNTENSLGEYVHAWTPGAALANGLYIVSLYVDEALMHTAKVIYKK